MTPAKPQATLADQTHWYDGWWYRRVIDPMSGGGLARAVTDFLDPGTTVLDIACGTGALACHLASHCREVVGIDLSSKMIAFARQQATKQGLRNLDFQHAGALGLSKRFPRRFDYAVMTQFLHSVPESLRQRLAAELPALADRFVVADFVAPLPRSFAGVTIHLVELLEGRSSYRAFRQWIARGGLDGFLARQGLRPIGEKIYHSRLGKIVLAA
jgi:SAM-dependent methyltransferase